MWKKSLRKRKQEDLQDQVMGWLQTPDWEASWTYLQTHPSLLTDAAEQLLKVLKYAQEEVQTRIWIDLHQQLLHQVRVEGIKIAYEHCLAQARTRSPATHGHNCRADLPLSNDLEGPEKRDNDNQNTDRGSEG